MDSEVIDDAGMLQTVKNAIDYELRTKPKTCWMCGERCPTDDIPDSWQCSKGHQVSSLGWEWSDVAPSYTMVSRMAKLGICRIKYKSNKHTQYLLTDRDKAIELVTASENHMSGALVPDRPSISQLPKDLFGNIVGYEDIKKLMSKAITADQPVHVLFVGPPASAKTMFQIAIEALPGAFFIDGANLTKAGLNELLFNHEIRYLEIDEIEEVAARDQAALISFMQTGRLSETKYGRTRTKHMNTWVIGSCNDTVRLSAKLLSRFLIVEFGEYTYEQFMEIVIRVLQRSRPSMLPDTISRIGDAVWHTLRSRDIRDVIKIAALVSDNEGDLDWIIRTLSHRK